MYTRITYKEIACLLLVVSTLLLVLLPACQSMRSTPESNRILCQQNLKNIGVALKMYADENEGMYPPLRQREFNSDAVNKYTMMLDATLLYPKYINDINIFMCPADFDVSKDNWLNETSKLPDPTMVDDNSYVYLAWSANEDTYNNLNSKIGSPYLKALEELFEKDDAQQWDRDLVYSTGEKGEIHFPRTNTKLWENSDNYAAKVPIMFDRLMQQGVDPTSNNITVMNGYFTYNHIPGGSYVLYADGHVEFVRFCPPDCSPFPVDHGMALFLGNLDSGTF